MISWNDKRTGAEVIVAAIGGMVVGFLLGLLLYVIPAHAQLTSLSPDLVVDCPGGVLPCTIRSASPIIENISQSMTIDNAIIGLTLRRNSVIPMSDTIVDPSVIGINNALQVCTTSSTDHIVAASPVINGRTSIDVAPWQCAAFSSDGTHYLVELSWQASARQRCPGGQHMISAAPFLCSP